VASEIASIPAFLEAIRTQRGLSLRALALYVGVAASAMNKWRSGHQLPDPASCRKLAEFSGYPEEFILMLAGHVKPHSPIPQPQLTIDPEVRLLIESLTLADQRRWVLPAVELALELREPRAGEEGSPEHPPASTTSPYPLRPRRKGPRT
jgi:transcriptional regulator with XRE-family HTH domain